MIFERRKESIPAGIRGRSRGLYPYIKSWSESRLSLCFQDPRPLAGKVTCGLNVHTNASRYTEVLFEDLRFLVGGQELLLILETNSGCLFSLRSGSLYLSVWPVANLVFGESVPRRHALRFWHY